MFSFSEWGWAIANGYLPHLHWWQGKLRIEWQPSAALLDEWIKKCEIG